MGGKELRKEVGRRETGDGENKYHMRRELAV
jgi:hypothetical protein